MSTCACGPRWACRPRPARAVPGERPALELAALRCRGPGRGGPSRRNDPVLRLRHDEDPPAARGHHLRHHRPALVHEHREDPGAARRAQGGARERGRRRARCGHAVLLVQRRARVHRLRVRRRAARRDPVVPDREPPRERGRARAPLRDVRVEDRGPLPLRRADHRRRGRLHPRTPAPGTVGRAVRVRREGRDGRPRDAPQLPRAGRARPARRP